MGLFCLKSHLFHPFPGSLYALTRMVNGWVSLAWCFTRADE